MRPLVSLLLLFWSSTCSAVEPIITLPIRFHLTNGAKITVKGQVMENWIKPADLTGRVLAEVNQIWKQAGIQFVTEQLLEEPILKPANFAELLEAIERPQSENLKNASDEAHEIESASVNAAGMLVDRTQKSPRAMNIYVLPYLSAHIAGRGPIGTNSMLISTWHGGSLKQPPQKRLLSEIAATIAHEIGHNLGLRHPGDFTSESSGGKSVKKAGYTLTADEVAKASVAGLMTPAGQGKELLAKEIAKARESANEKIAKWATGAAKEIKKVKNKSATAPE